MGFVPPILKCKLAFNVTIRMQPTGMPVNYRRGGHPLGWTKIGRRIYPILFLFFSIKSKVQDISLSILKIEARGQSRTKSKGNRCTLTGSFVATRRRGRVTRDE